MMADQPAAEAMIDQPGVAVRAGEAEAAGAAQRQRRIAAAIEEQQRLLAALERGLHRLGEPRRDEAAARRAFARAGRSPRSAGRCWPPKRSGRCRRAIAAAPRVDLGLDRRRRRGQHDRDFGDARAHHRHVAGVIAHAVLLLVGGVVLLIDDDQAEIGVGQEQRRARADDDAHLAGRDRAPGARALARRQLANAIPPGARRSARRSGRGTARSSAISGIRISACRPRRIDLGHRLEIDLGLARAGDAVEQRHRVAALGDGRAQRVGRRALRRR